MLDRGTFSVARIDYHDSDFDGDEFSPRDAWHFLVGSACYAPTTARIAGVVVDLDRGQCGFSVRFLAEKWGWSKSRVDRFLDRIETSGKIRRERVGPGKSPGITLLTVRHYNAMQAGVGSTTRRETGTAAGQQRDSSTGTGGDDELRSSDKGLFGREHERRDSLRGGAEAQQRDSSGTKKNSETQDIKKESSLRSEYPASHSDADGIDEEGHSGLKLKTRKHAWPSNHFSIFWNEWPKKVDRGEAEKILKIIYRKDAVSFDDIISGVRRLAASIESPDDKRYCQGPARWLRADGWTNEIIKRSSRTSLAGESKNWWLKVARNADARLRGLDKDAPVATDGVSGRDDSEHGRSADIVDAECYPVAPGRIPGW